MNVAKFLIVVSAVASLFSSRVDACTCELRPPPCYDYWKMDAVFVGTIGKVHGNQEHPSGTVEDRVEVKVDKNYRGMDTDSSWTYNAGHSCAFHFRTGDRYLFYAVLDDKDKRQFGVSFCTRTARLTDNTIDLDFLDRLQGGSPTYWIWATISDSYGDFGLAGVKATATARDFAVSATSDSKGDLRLVVPREGSYRVRVRLPKDKMYYPRLRNDKSLWEEQRKIVRKLKEEGKNRYVDYEVVVKPNKCAWIDLSLMGRH